MDCRRTNKSTKVAPRPLLLYHRVVSILAILCVLSSLLGRRYVSACGGYEPRALVGKVGQSLRVVCASALPTVASSVIAESEGRGHVHDSPGGETIHGEDMEEEIGDVGDLMDIVAKEQEVVVDPDVVRRNELILSAIGKK